MTRVVERIVGGKRIEWLAVIAHGRHETAMAVFDLHRDLVAAPPFLRRTPDR